MNLIGRVLLIAACVFTAYALPNLSHVEVSKENVMLQSVLSLLKNTMNVAVVPLNGTQDSCLNAYSNRLSEINNQTVNQTQACYDAADRDLSLNNNSTNQTLVAVNAQSKELQTRLADCSLKNTTETAFNCYISTFDDNLANLFNATIQSQLAVAVIASNQNEVAINRDTCVGNVLTSNKIDSTVAAKDFQSCLSNASNSTQSGNKTMTYYLD